MTSRLGSPRVFRWAALTAVALMLASCQEEHGYIQPTGGAKAQRPLRPEILKTMADKGMRKEDPILVRVFKQDSTLEVWKRDRSGKFAFLKDYKICAWGGTIGPKIVQGDKQSPEGFYTVTPWRMNPNSQYHLSFDIGYPNAFDRAFGRTGDAIMVHGACSSAGCFAMTDGQVEEIYALAREAFAGGQASFQVQSYPFRMTASNMARNRNNPHIGFWRNLKEGYDHFEVTRLEPKVEVCNRRYVFDPKPKDPASATFNPTGECPAFEVPEHIAVAVAAKRTADDGAMKVEMAALEEKEKNAVAAALEKKLIETKPKDEGTLMASLFAGTREPAPGEAAGAKPAMTPIAVPLPRPAPGRPAGAAQPADTASVEAKSEGTLGRIGGMFGFGAKAEPESPAAAAVSAAAVPSEKPAGERAGGDKPAPSGTVATLAPPPKPELAPAPKPAAAPRAAAPQAAATVSPGPVAAPAAEPAKTESRSFWQRINPF